MSDGQHADPPDVITVRALSKRYAHVQALAGIDLTVRQGEIFGLLGPNGGGKTTLIKILVGSSRPTAGAVQVLGLDPRGQSRTLRRQIGYMPQAPALYDDLSPRHNLRFFGQAHAVANLDQRIDAALELIGLQARARDAVYGFSGGMKQRLSLACALLHEPRVLFLDEPTAGVDPKLRETFWEHFRALAAGGVTILVSTHQMDEALFCDRLAILRDGAVLATDTPHGLLRRGRTQVRLWRGRGADRPAEEATLADYAEQLPEMLQRYGLDAAVDRIELEHDTLETIVLRLINAADRRSDDPQDGADDSRC